MGQAWRWRVLNPKDALEVKKLLDPKDIVKECPETGEFWFKDQSSYQRAASVMLKVAFEIC